MRADSRKEYHVNGDTLTVDGEAFDFTPIPEGATLPAGAVDGDWLASDVTRTNGEIYLSVAMAHGVNAPHETLFPEVITETSGLVDFPPYDEVLTDED